MPTYLRPTAPVAPQALLPGDPKLAMVLARALTERPLMANLSRGLWGYHGRTPSGIDLTVQSTGIGGPSAAVVISELAALGVNAAIRIGSCVALDPELDLGAAIVVSEAIAADGLGSALAADARVAPDVALSQSLVAAAKSAPAAPVATTGFRDGDPASAASWRTAGAVAVDLSSAAILAVGRSRGIAVASALVVAESAAGHRLDDSQLEAALLDLGADAAAALTTRSASGA